MFVLGFFTVWLLVSFATYSPCLASSFPRGLARSRLALLVTLSSQAYVARPRLFSPCPAPRSVARFGVTCRPHNHDVTTCTRLSTRMPECLIARLPARQTLGWCLLAHFPVRPSVRFARAGVPA